MEKETETFIFRFVTGKDMFYIPWNGSGENLEKLYTVIDKYKPDILSGRMWIYVDGYCASTENRQAALALAKIRSNRVKSDLIVHKGLREEFFITKNHTTPYQGQKNVVVVTLQLPIPPKRTQP
ncbi:MAG: hypothetical protein LIP01_09540 [Tannerellaceae bacterium]|nr:hypothetical protein [Tannerellaceae bacterium]